MAGVAFNAYTPHTWGLAKGSVRDCQRCKASCLVQVYTVSGGKSVPAWLSDKKKRSLKKDEAYRRRIELVQDLDFPEACQRLRASPDGQYLFATGIHPPRVPFYTCNRQSLV